MIAKKLFYLTVPVTVSLILVGLGSASSFVEALVSTDIDDMYIQIDFRDVTLDESGSFVAYTPSGSPITFQTSGTLTSDGHLVLNPGDYFCNPIILEKEGYNAINGIFEVEVGVDGLTLRWNYIELVHTLDPGYCDEENVLGVWEKGLGIYFAIAHNPSFIELTNDTNSSIVLDEFYVDYNCVPYYWGPKKPAVNIRY